MKNQITLVTLLVLTLTGLTVIAAGANAKLELKTGDSVYACACGSSCPCQTISMKPGQCTCGKDLVKAEVLKVAETTVDLKFASETRTMSRIGRYVCGCGEGCNCMTISQSSGKCSCGTDLVEAES